MTEHASDAPQFDLFLDPTSGTIPGPGALRRQQAGKELPDQEARDRIKSDLDASLFVEAAAGAGKTTALVSRIVSTLAAGRGELERMVAVTFTDKAAGEMKLRLRTAIEEARKGDPDEPPPPVAVRERLDGAVRQLEVSRIGTIHSFCSEILRERPVEAGVDPLFDVLPQDEAARLLDRAFEAWFEEVLEDPPPGVRRVLRRPPAGWRRTGPRDQLREAAGRLVEHRDFPAAWTRDEEFDHVEAMDRAVERLRELAEYAPPGEPPSWLHRGFAKIGRWVEETDLREEAAPRDPDALEARLREVLSDRKAGWTYRGSGDWYRRDLPLADVKSHRDEVKAELDALLEASEADLAARLREELRPVVDRYEALKRREGALDFLDLLLRTRDLVRDRDDVRRELQGRFTHFFVDEFQDTDPLQAEILLLLAADDPEETDWREATPAPGKLFLVGDPKQSIYSFRRADVRIYEETKRRLVERGTDLLRLTTSFRSVPGIQETVNAAFRRSIRPVPDGSQAEYVPLERFRERTAGQPAVVALPAPRPYSDFGRIVHWRVSESYAEAAAAFVDWLVRESGWRVTEPGRPHDPVPIRPRHVCILSRRLQSRYEEVMRPYVRGLEAREIPHVLVGGKWFHEREEVLALRNVLSAVEWPDDALSVYATLRGPFFALTDGDLLAFKERHGSLHPLGPAVGEILGQAMSSDDGPPPAAERAESADREVAEALRILARLHRRRNRRPIAATLSEFLAEVRAHAGIAIRPAGEQALANCLRLVDRARTFERGGARSFRAFVEMLEDEAEREEGEDAPIVEEGTQGVRIMSVHRAKGLEFPVVLLADPTCRATLDTPSRHVDPDRGLWAERLCGAVPADVLDHREEERAREEAEAVRLAYVAATRARDVLVVPTVGDGEPLEGWAQYLNPAIYPEEDARRSPDGVPGAGAPSGSGEEPIGAVLPWERPSTASGAEEADDRTVRADEDGGEGASDGPLSGCPAFGDDTVLERPPRARGRGTRAAVKPGLHASRAGSPTVWWDPAVLDLDPEEAVGLRQREILAADEAGEVSTAGVRAHGAWRERKASVRREASVPELEVETVTARARREAESREDEG